MQHAYNDSPSINGHVQHTFLHVQYGMEPLEAALQNLADDKTRLLRLPLIDGANPAVLAEKIINSLNIPTQSLLDVEEMRGQLIESGISTIVLLISDANLFSASTIQKLFSILNAVCHDVSSICWVIDDVCSFARLPLPIQMTLNFTKIEMRPPIDLIVDLIGELLANEFLPSADLILKFLEVATQPHNSALALEQLIRLAILEATNIQWNTLTYEMIPSFKRAISNENDEKDDLIKLELISTYLGNARIAVRRLFSVWKVLTIICNLFGEDFCTPDDLLRNIFVLQSCIPAWFDKLNNRVSGGSTMDMEGIARRLRIFDRQIEALLPCPYLKDLIPGEMMANGLNLEIWSTFISRVTNWCMAQLPLSWSDVPLHETLILTFGRTTAKLFNPRIVETVQLALTHPEFYFTGTSTEGTCEGPDASIVYKLSEECGRFINTLDWFVSFRESVDSKKTLPEPALMMRFLRAVHELHLMGMVAPTKKRKDHYERLVVYHRPSYNS